MNVQGSYKTLLKSDPQYAAYLLGTFSKCELALPMESFGVGSERERTTFLIVPAENFSKSHWTLVYLRAIRPELLGLTFGHALIALVSLKFFSPEHNISNPLAMVLCLLATLFAHASACLFNDYQDHLNGTDRKSSSHGSRVIQKAWSTAFEVRRWALVNAALAFSIGAYLLFGNWLVLLGLSGLSAMAILFYSGMTPFWNKWGAGDFWITLLFGPLLFFSVWASVIHQENIFALPNEVLANGFVLSLCFGFLASWTLQMRQFQDIFKREKGSFRTLISRLNFDQAKKFLFLEGSFFFFLQSLGCFLIWNDLRASSLLWIGAMVFSIGLFSVNKIVSPLSSQILALTKKALLIHSGFIGLWVLTLWIK